jgi:hypothetical protein
MDVGAGSLPVRDEHLGRWGVTVEEVAVTALANLRRTARTWDGTAYPDSLDGLPIYGLQGWPHWAASLILLPDELIQLFGSHDQLFIAPYACNLLSLPIEVDREIAAGVIQLFGEIDPSSLLLGIPAFALRRGAVVTEELPGLPDRRPKDASM